MDARTSEQKAGSHTSPLDCLDGATSRVFPEFWDMLRRGRANHSYRGHRDRRIMLPATASEERLYGWFAGCALAASAGHPDQPEYPETARRHFQCCGLVRGTSGGSPTRGGVGFGRAREVPPLGRSRLRTKVT